MRPHLVLWCCVLALLLSTAHAYGPCISDELLPPPNGSISWQDWFNGMSLPEVKSPAHIARGRGSVFNWLVQFKTVMLKQINFTSQWYDDQRLNWSAGAFIQPQMMAHERYFYDPSAGSYTVKRYLQDLIDRYGGIDAVLIWHSYPNIGLDDRNQFDMLRSLPGFPHKVRDMIKQFHAEGVKVLFPYNPWDTGTRDEGVTDAVAIAQLWKQIGADGVNGDTLSLFPKEFFDASLAVDHPLVLQAEDMDQVAPNLSWQVSGWGYWGPYIYQPCVSALKWLKPSHLTNVCDRWGQDHTDDLQWAFFNGAGFETWENVWGYWNQLVPRDAMAVRRIATILRHFGKSLLLSPDWVPHLETPNTNVTFVSQWRNNQTHERLWLLVNRSPQNVSGVQLIVPSSSSFPHFFNIWDGTELLPTHVGDGKVSLSFLVEARGYGAVYAIEGSKPSRQFMEFLHSMRAIGKRLLESYSDTWVVMNQTMTDQGKTAPPTATTGMVLIKSNPSYQFICKGNALEGGNRIGVDVQFPWEPYPQRIHNQTLSIPSFWIDKYPVTNSQYLSYLKQSGYSPADGGQNFLRSWKKSPNWTYPAGWDNKPVTWVSIEDAREYCSYYKKRLPNSWEWQYAAQGTDGRTYPWGNNWDNGQHVPVPCKDRTMRAADDVDAHPSGASPFGVMDMVGNVYQWTNEFADLHTRSATIRGGNYYQPQGSRWYLPQSYSLYQHTKLLLMAPSMDRSAGVGFRCMSDS